MVVIIPVQLNVPFFVFGCVGFFFVAAVLNEAKTLMNQSMLVRCW